MRLAYPSDVAVVVPAYKGPDPIEAFALRRNATLLNGYPFHLLCPESLDSRDYEKLVADITIVRVANDDMSTWRGYSSLLCSHDFYRRFESFDYVLILQLDGLVLDESTLIEWLGQGYDYVGPPWFSRGAGVRNRAPTPKKNGIGGVSLRRIDAFMSISSGDRRPRRIARLPDCSLYRNPKWRCSCMIRGPHSWHKVNEQALNGSLLEDEYWAFHVPRWFDWNVPAPYQSLRFAFHFHPRLSYEIVGAVPFAVHGRENIEAIYSIIDGSRSSTKTVASGSSEEDFWREMIASVDYRPAQG